MQMEKYLHLILQMPAEAEKKAKEIKLLGRPGLC